MGVHATSLSGKWTPLIERRGVLQRPLISAREISGRVAAFCQYVYVRALLSRCLLFATTREWRASPFANLLRRLQDAIVQVNVYDRLYTDFLGRTVWCYILNSRHSMFANTFYFGDLRCWSTSSSFLFSFFLLLKLGLKGCKRFKLF